MSRCAIYTRKSTEERLDMRFNSLEAQTDACRAYIASQVHAGWICMEEQFADPGFSGGTLNRPALQRLLAKARNREIDVVVVHKVDRLTRSLSDFANLAELFEQYGVSFVSVTQHLDTSTSMGRLSLNVLLSFAQFEREIASERIKEKIHASRKRGLWTGGRVPLGYRAVEKKLVIDKQTAPLVRAIFARYLDLRGFTDLYLEWKVGKFEHWIANPSGQPLPSRAALYTILRNPVYAGILRCGDELVNGIHKGIVDVQTWRSVQVMLDENRHTRGAQRRRTDAPSLLGRIFDEKGQRLTRSHTRKKAGNRYTYYVSADSTRNARQSARLRIPCSRLEALVAHAVAARIADPHKRIAWAEKASLDPDAFSTVAAWTAPESRLELNAFAISLIERVDIIDGTARIGFQPSKLLASIIRSPRLLKSPKDVKAEQLSVRDPILLSCARSPKTQIVRQQLTDEQIRKSGRQWFTLLVTGKAKSMEEIAEAYGVSQPTVSRRIAAALAL
ncbi:MAG: recombinase family protein [Oricola sp.]